MNETGSSVPLSEVKADLFHALAHPARVRVLEVLADGERSVGELAPLVGIESSHLSQQLGVLRRAGLVTTAQGRLDGLLRDPRPARGRAAAGRQPVLLASLLETRDLLAGLARRGALMAGACRMSRSAVGPVASPPDR